MPVQTQEGISDIEVVPQCPGEEDLFCPAPMKHRPDAGSDSGCDQNPEECQDEAKAPVTSAAYEAPFEPPDDDLAARIVAQVEFYFSDVNITKNVFLLKQVKRNQGYVSLKLISSFNTVKHLAKDWRAVAYALEKSAKLQVNEAGTRVRRIDPLPQYDETAPSRTVAAIDLPLERPTIKTVAELFSPCGEIALVRILRPGNPVPLDARPFVAKLPELANTMCALVEFEKSEAARGAVKEAAERANREGKPGMRVLELTKATSKENSKGEAAAKKNNQILQRQLRQPQSQMLSVQSKKKGNERTNARPSSVAVVVMGGGADAEERPAESSRKRWSGPLERLQHRRTSNTTCSNSARLQRHKPLCQTASSPGEAGRSPWVQRSMAAASIHARPGAPQPRPRSSSGALTGTLVLPPNVLRMPRGPDGTRGFKFVRR